MASHSSPLLLDLRDEDFERGFTGSRPPSLLAPAPKAKAIREAAPRSRRGGAIALFVAAIAGSVVTAKLLNSTPPQHTVVGFEAVQESEQPKEPAKPIAAPVVAEVSKPVVQTAVVERAKPIYAPPKSKAAPAIAKSVTAEVVKPAAPETAKAETPTYGVEEAGF